MMLDDFQCVEEKFIKYRTESALLAKIAQNLRFCAFSCSQCSPQHCWNQAKSEKQEAIVQLFQKQKKLVSILMLLRNLGHLCQGSTIVRALSADSSKGHDGKQIINC